MDRWEDRKSGQREDSKSNLSQKYVLVLVLVVVLHEIRSISMNQSTESETTLPGSSQITNGYATVTTNLVLAPSQQLIGLREGICQRGRDRRDQ